MPDPPSKLFESAAVSAGPYPGGLGPHTGRDPNVKKPGWLRQRAPQGEKYSRLHDSLAELKLNTVCVEAQCPNIGEVGELALEISSAGFFCYFFLVSSLLPSGLVLKLFSDEF